MKLSIYKLFSVVAILLILVSALGIGSNYLCTNEFNHLGCPLASLLYSPFGHEAGSGVAVAIIGFITYLMVGVIGLAMLLIVWAAGTKKQELRPRPKTLLLSAALILIILFGTIAYQRVYEAVVVPRLIEQRFQEVTGTTPEQAQSVSCPGGLLGVALVRYPSCPECDKAEDFLTTINLGERLKIFNLASPEALPDPYSGNFNTLADVLFSRIASLYQAQAKRSIYHEPGSSFRADTETSGVMVSACKTDILFDFTNKSFDAAPVQSEIGRAL